MEDFRIDVMTGDGAFASSIQIPVQPFTLIGATTRTGLLTAPLSLALRPHHPPRLLPGAMPGPVSLMRI